MTAIIADIQEWLALSLFATSGNERRDNHTKQGDLVNWAYYTYIYKNDTRATDPQNVNLKGASTMEAGNRVRLGSGGIYKCRDGSEGNA